MRIGALQKFSAIDYPKKISCIVFVKGCNFCCGYCYNKQLVFPTLYNKTEDISENVIFDFLNKRKNQLDGVVITGGEPTIYEEKLIEFIKKIKEIGFSVKLDTNGSNPKLLKKIISEKIVDYIAMDVKQVFEKYYLFTKENIENIKKSIELLKNSEIEHEFRVVTHPDMEMCDFEKIISYLPNQKVFVQDFVQGDTIKPYKNYKTIFSQLSKNNLKYTLR